MKWCWNDRFVFCIHREKKYGTNDSDMNMIIFEQTHGRKDHKFDHIHQKYSKFYQVMFGYLYLQCHCVKNQVDECRNAP